MLALPLVLLSVLADGTPLPSGPSFDRDVKPTLVTYCYECHGEGSARGDVAFDSLTSDQARRQAGPLWTRVWENVRNGYMPPPGSPRPPPAARAQLQTWIQRDVQGVDCRAPDPGRVTIRRLNRDEYNHTIADLFGIDFRPADDFPPDDTRLRLRQHRRRAGAVAAAGREVLQRRRADRRPGGGRPPARCPGG